VSSVDKGKSIDIALELGKLRAAKKRDGEHCGAWLFHGYFLI
jgi:hypothetical protein